jgi:hypothetical protein
MKSPSFNQVKYPPGRKVFFLICLLLLPVPYVFPQTADFTSIPLRVVSQVLSPDEYFITRILDERSDLSPTAFFVHDAKNGNNLRTANLKGGTIPALQQYILGAYPGDKAGRPIVVRIKDCKIIERLINFRTGLVEGDIHLDFTFALEREDELVDLLDFQGGLSYKRGVRQFHLIEPFLRRSVNLAMKYFDDWIVKDVSNNNILAQSVRINMRDYKGKNDGDTVFYATERPLTWADFKGRPRFNGFAASIFASIGYEANSRMENGEVVVDLVFKTYMLKSSSWVRTGNDSYGLNHEQRHFDIAKITIERLKSTLAKLELDPHNYDRKISFHYLEAYREMNRMQEKYDAKTAHGLNAPAQDRWNDKIDGLLRELGVK